MAEKIQTQFINPVNGSLYFEIYFKFIVPKEIDFADYQRIERLIEMELLKLREHK